MLSVELGLSINNPVKEQHDLGNGPAQAEIHVSQIQPTRQISGLSLISVGLPRYIIVEISCRDNIENTHGIYGHYVGGSKMLSVTLIREQYCC